MQTTYSNISFSARLLPAAMPQESKVRLGWCQNRNAVASGPPVVEQEKKVAPREYLQNMVATSQSVEITAGGRSDGRAFEVSR